MLKNILNLEGVQQLTTAEQKKIAGGKPYSPYNCTVNGCINEAYECCSTGYCASPGYCPQPQVPGLR